MTVSWAQAIAKSKTTKRTAESDRELFASMVQEHERYLFNIAYRLAGNREEAEDLVQEALVRAFRSFRSFEPGTSFKSWLYRIVSNLYVDTLRKRSKYREESLDEPIIYENGEFKKSIPDYSADPSQLVEETGFVGEVQKALDCLPAEYRLAVILCDVQGFSYEEIAEIMDCSIGTVRSRIHRGRKALRKYLEEFGKERNWLPGTVQ
ncbi:MAG: sigma-70 family RNA polymerase sigma factor [Firmicutes bacterium]|nr:sigma-70 family RNA polymerase sigma factor [Bacillota bacterium]